MAKFLRKSIHCIAIAEHVSEAENGAESSERPERAENRVERSVIVFCSTCMVYDIVVKSTRLLSHFLMSFLSV